MPYNSNNNRSSNRNSSSRGSRSTPARGKQQPAKRKQNEYNMLSWGVGFFDEDGKYPKVRILLKSDNANKPPTDEQDNEYTRDEAAYLVYQALLEGRGISLYLFNNDDGSMSGNARIDITGLEPERREEVQPKRKPAAKAASRKPVYPEPEEDEEEEEYEEEEVDEDGNL
jgi:hypothetical protein